MGRKSNRKHELGIGYRAAHGKGREAKRRAAIAHNAAFYREAVRTAAEPVEVSLEELLGSPPPRPGTITAEVLVEALKKQE